MANIYTCTAATGDINGLALIDNGVKISYTLSSTTAGSVEGNSIDGSYEAIGDDKLTLSGYSGVITVNNVSTQRVEHRLLTHDAKKLGSELVVNGGFDTDSNWLFGTGWSISDGKGKQDGTGTIQTIRQENVLISNASYIISLDIDVLESDYVQLRYHDGSAYHEIVVYRDIGTQSVTVDIGTTNGMLYIFNGTAGVVEIDNVSVKEVSQEDLLYIDSVLQPETPSLPDANETIKLNNVACIGYPDSITQVEDAFEVHSIVVVP